MSTFFRAVAILLLLSSLPVIAATTVETGLEERVRSEAYNGISGGSTGGTQRIQYRFRTRAWVRLELDPRFECAAGLDSESRDVVRPDTPYKWDEFVFETLYAGYRAGEHFSARVGRQNIAEGDGFVLFDGSALDGSRTAYVNAVDLAWTWPAAKLELIGISDPAHDTYLPRLNDRRKPLTEWNEQAVGAYATFRAGIEAYWFYKTETGDARSPLAAQFQPDRRLHTIGSRSSAKWGRGWSSSAEFALQFGNEDARPGTGGPGADIRAWGGQARVAKTFGGDAHPSLSLGYVGLSGDDPNTRAVEGWDPLFSRWPKWSELYVYTLAAEKGVAYWSNLGMWQLEFQATPWKPLALRATWYRMQAFEPARGPGFGAGGRRGDLYQARADVVLGPHWKGHVLYERFEPDSFYTVHDPGYFLRFEVTYGLVAKHTAGATS